MADSLPEIPSDYVCPIDAKEEILNECESIWKHMEEESQKDKLLTVLRDCCLMHACQNKLMLQGTETLLKSDVKLALLMMQVKTLTAEYHQWQKRSPELTSTNPDVLLTLGKEELQKVKNDLEMMLSTIQSKNKQLEKDLKREQQWHEEQEQLLDALNGIEEETKPHVPLSKKCLNIEAFHELQKEMLKLKMYKEELLNALGGFLEEHFPLPEKGGRARMKNSSEEPAVELITLNEILEILINKLISTPHEPYVAINDSFWPPYIELLLRHGIALRHPEDPNRLRLEAFHM